MKLIVGLGNPGKEYEQTRHNIGFMVVDELRNQLAGIEAFHLVSKYNAMQAKVGNDVLLVKPQTFMNDSGRAVRGVLDYYKVPASEWASSVYVVHGDLDIPLGSYEFHLGKGPKVHNGLLSIYQSLGTEEFWHVRVGVDNRQGQRFGAGRDYVLQPFLGDEKETIAQVIADNCKRMKQEVNGN